MTEDVSKPGLQSLLVCSVVALLVASCTARESHAQNANPTVSFEMSAGTVEIELFANEAPISVGNFLAYHESGFFEGTVCHRVVPDFMIQCGGFTADMNRKETRPSIQNEADNGLENLRGTLAMARTSAVDSATAQFFINLKDNDHLNHGTSEAGYAVFGRVIRGMDIVDAIAAVRTAPNKGHLMVPVEPVILETRKSRPAS